MTRSNPPRGEDANPYAPPRADLRQEAGRIGRPSQAFQGAVAQALVAQAVVLVLTGLNLDFGRSQRFCALVALAYWAAVIVVVGPRRRSPTRLDLAFVRVGYWVLLLVAWVAGPVVLRLVGSA